MKIAVLTTDSREHDRAYSDSEPRFGTAPEALLIGFREIPDIEIHVISCLQRPVLSPEKLADNIYYHGLHVPKTGWLRTGYQGCIRAVRARLKETRPDIVHGQGTERDCAISAAFSQFPNLVTIHGNMRLLAKLQNAKPWSFLGLAAMLEHLTLRKTDGVICITNYTEQNVKKLNPKTWIVPNAVDSSFFSVRNEPSNPPIILCAGLVCERKNQNALIDALAPLVSEVEFQLIFLGNAPAESDYVRTFFQKIAQRPWIHHGGFAGRNELKSALAGAALVVLPSLEDNCPMVVLEAAAAGVPVVAARVGGVPELIQDGVSGLLCDPLDPESIRYAVRQVLTSPDRGRTLAREGKAGALERFHPVSVARRHVEVYRELLG